jgi:membrane protein
MIKKIKGKLIASPPVQSLISFSKRTSLPGFKGASMYYVVSFFQRGIAKGNVNTRASALAFHFFLALFPSIIFLFTLIPFVPVPNFQDKLLATLELFVPDTAFDAAKETIIEIVTRQNGGLLSFGFFLAMYFSTNGFNAIINNFNKSYHTTFKRSPLRQRLTSLYMVLLTNFVILAGVTLLVFTEYALKNYLHEVRPGVKFVIVVGRWVLMYFMFLLLISIIYFMAPASTKNRWSFFSPGSMFATFLMVAASLGFAYFVNNFGAYNKIYGSLGSLIVVMLWIYFNSLFLLLGFELNASISSAGKNAQWKVRDSGNK